MIKNNLISFSFIYGWSIVSTVRVEGGKFNGEITLKEEESGN